MAGLPLKRKCYQDVCIADLSIRIDNHALVASLALTLLIASC